MAQQRCRFTSGPNRGRSFPIQRFKILQTSTANENTVRGGRQTECRPPRPVLTAPPVSASPAPTTPQAHSSRLPSVISAASGTASTLERAPPLAALRSVAAFDSRRACPRPAPRRPVARGGRTAASRCSRYLGPASAAARRGVEGPQRCILTASVAGCKNRWHLQADS